MTAPKRGKRTQLLSESNIAGLKRVAETLRAEDPLERRVTLDEALKWLLDEHDKREGPQ